MWSYRERCRLETPIWDLSACGQHLKPDLQEFSGGPVAKNPSCNAGDVGLIPDGRTKIPHAAEQLSQQLEIPRAATKAQYC